MLCLGVRIQPMDKVGPWFFLGVRPFTHGDESWVWLVFCLLVICFLFFLKLNSFYLQEFELNKLQLDLTLASKCHSFTP